MKNNLPLVSVIIPTYKRPGMLGRAIDSVLNQTYPNIEMIIVDDNSEGDTYRQETEKFMKKYEENLKIKYIKHKKNQGGSIARNTGIDRAEGEYIAFLDDDDEFLPLNIEKQYETFVNSKKKDLGFVFCEAGIYDDSSQKLMQISKADLKIHENLLEKHLIKNIACTITIFVEKKVVKKIGGFKNLESGQDWFFVLEILAAGYAVDCTKEILVKIYIHDKERISVGHKKIESLDVLFRIKEKYSVGMKKRVRKKIFQAHYLLLFNHSKHMYKKKALLYLLKAFLIRPFSLLNLYYFFTIFFSTKALAMLKIFREKIKL